MANIKEKLKSKVFWTELVILIAQALKLFGVYEISNETLNAIQDLVTLLFSVFATLNNPNNRGGF